LNTPLVFRCAVLDSRQMRNEIGALRPELVFRHIPGHSVQRRRHPALRIIASIAGGLAFLQPPRGGVLAVARPPRRLRRDTPLRLALGVRAGALAIAYAGISTEPLAALATRTRLRHPPIVIDPRRSSKVDWFWRADPD